jgi:LPPG:FO 2-phospho-L-lactate transferase
VNVGFFRNLLEGRSAAVGAHPQIAVLAGGVGAARLLRGLIRVVDPVSLSVIVNTGDDEEFFGLHVSPDLDTIMYTLAGAVDQEKGWGREEDTFACLEALGRYYPETWFRLGDKDLATHLFRTEQLHQGKPLSEVTRALARAWGITAALRPMTDEPVRTVVYTEDGPIPFQEYFVKRRAQGAIQRVAFRGIEEARPAPGVCEAILAADLILLPPSNPIVSIGPILALPGMRDTLRNASAPIVGVSPIVAGRPIKGPADRMLAGLGIEVSPVGVASLYQDFLDVFVIDEQDAGIRTRLEKMEIKVAVTDTVMSDIEKSIALAKTVLRRAKG